MPLRVKYALSAVLQVLRYCITGALRTTDHNAENAIDNDGESMEIGAPMAASPFKPDSVEVVKQVTFRFNFTE